MAAPKGNEYWRLADWGKPKSYQPDELWQKALEYFEWCEEHPWIKNDAVKGGESAGMLIRIPTARPFTLHGLCIFAGIVTSTFYNYEGDEAYLPVTTRIREIIYSQKFEGAAVGAFNPSIIARDLGLSDKVENRNENYNMNVEPTPEEAQRIKDALLKSI